MCNQVKGCHNPRGALNFGLRAMCHQKDPTFFRSLSPKDPHFYQLSPNDPLFFENFNIFDEMLRNFWPFWPRKPLFSMHFTERPPIFVRFVTQRPPFFDAICHRKTPTSEVLGGTRTSLSYVSAPPGHNHSKSHQ